jgi:hypothetical protein
MRGRRLRRPVRPVTFQDETPALQSNFIQVKLHSSYAFTGGVTVSDGFVYSAGVPVSAFAARLLGDINDIYLVPRG